VTLDDDLAQKVKDYAHRTRTSFKVALNTLLSRGLASQEPRQEPRSRFRVAPHSGGFKPGVDVAKLNQLVDQLDMDEFTRKHRRGR
jgi:hypothetical protein